MERATIITILDGWRLTAGLDKLTVARRLGVSRQLVSAWLNPTHTLNPSIEQVADFGLVCKVPRTEIGSLILTMAGLGDLCAIPDSGDGNSRPMDQAEAA